MKKALITGATGQDGSYLAELLLSKGYEVYALVRRTAAESDEVRFKRINHILKDIHIVGGSVENYQSIHNAISKVKPDELYHLAAQSFVADSFTDEFSTTKINSEGTHNVLACLKAIVPECRFYFAGSSEQFGEVLEKPQKETTPFNPRSVYGVSKCAGFYLTKHYRNAHGIHASSGLLFNHESPRRGKEFVTRKITWTVPRIHMGLESKLHLGNLDALRDWGHAKDYVEAMWLMLQQEKPDDYVIATGQTHSVRDFCKAAFGYYGMDYEQYVVVDPKFFRPTDVNLLIGDATKAKEVLGWEPKTSFKDLVHQMIESDYEDLRKIMNL
jgi:GDPmannose 4,6-dehydratase